MKKKQVSKKSAASERAFGRKPLVFPPHLGMTPNEWRGLKRMEWRSVVAALDTFAHGSELRAVIQAEREARLREESS